MTEPLVSVVMSVHDGEQWLGQAIDSIVAQTYEHWELVIVDDASNAATQELLERYRQDRRIIIKRRDVRRGLAANLNYAIGFCSGSLIARIDADDIALPQRLSEQVAFMTRSKETAVVASYVDLIDDVGLPKGGWPDDRETTDPTEIRRRLPWRNCIAHSSVMIRREVFSRYRYNEAQAHSQDWDLWMQLACDGHTIAKIAEVLVLYRVHDRSITHANSRAGRRKVDAVYRNYLRSQRGRLLKKFNREVVLAFLANAAWIPLSRFKRAALERR